MQMRSALTIWECGGTMPKNEGAEEDTIPTIQVRPEEPGETGERNLLLREFFQLLAQLGVGHRTLEQRPDHWLEFHRSHIITFSATSILRLFVIRRQTGLKIISEADALLIK